MKVLVLNISHWVGYHIANRLLQEGYEVRGLEGETSNSHLVDFISRNSNFELITSRAEITFPLAICVGEIPQQVEYNYDQLIQINGENTDTTDRITIHTPYLFGEWMPMTEEACYIGGNCIRFSSQEFLEEGVYIKDFLEVLLELLESPPASPVVFVRSARNRSLKGKKLEKTFLVDENIAIEENLNQVKEHFQKFQALYPDVGDCLGNM